MKTYQKQTDPMNQTYKSLPIIDIQPFINGSARRNVADQVIEACKEIGFLIIKGHEIEETVINDAFNASKSFFDLPQNIKNKCVGICPCGTNWVHVKTGKGHTRHDTEKRDD